VAERSLESRQYGTSGTDRVVTTLMRDGNLLYAIAVAPRDDYRGYQNAFARAVISIHLTQTTR
jgi:hypothetical protein